MQTAKGKKSHCEGEPVPVRTDSWPPQGSSHLLQLRCPPGASGSTGAVPRRELSVLSVALPYALSQASSSLPSSLFKFHSHNQVARPLVPLQLGSLLYRRDDPRGWPDSPSPLPWQWPPWSCGLFVFSFEPSDSANLCSLPACIFFLLLLLAVWNFHMAICAQCRGILECQLSVSRRGVAWATNSHSLLAL